MNNVIVDMCQTMAASVFDRKALLRSLDQWWREDFLELGFYSHRFKESRDGRAGEWYENLAVRLVFLRMKICIQELDSRFLKHEIEA